VSSNKVIGLVFAPAEGESLEVLIRPALGRVNALYRLACEQVLAPYHFAAQAGKLSEGTARTLMAKIYAEAVIQGSSAPALAGFEPRQWEGWLLAFPERFDAMRGVAENPASWGLDAGWADDGSIWPEEDADGDRSVSAAGGPDGGARPADHEGD
jgi:hypothetical protein